MSLSKMFDFILEEVRFTDPKGPVNKRFLPRMISYMVYIVVVLVKNAISVGSTCVNVKQFSTINFLTFCSIYKMIKKLNSNIKLNLISVARVELIK